VVHQYGPRQDWDLPAAENYIPFPYINEEMPHVLAAAELVVGRSGAGTIWESAVCGKPMILIPLSGSGTRGDQVENAGFFEREGAAIVLGGGQQPGREATVENLSRMVNDIAEDSGRREGMAKAARRIGSLDGAAIIGDSIYKFIFKGE
jgi:UDP-N-acetylglucosamine--N-acetylmuramyl-(pentapeptide) pyrophosphoryl-undecaprenol N-acetylglucosamine transferase